MKRLWYVGPPITGVLPLPEGMARPDDWAAGIEFEDDVATRTLAKHGSGGSGQWSDVDPRGKSAKGKE